MYFKNVLGAVIVPPVHKGHEGGQNPQCWFYVKRHSRSAEANMRLQQCELDKWNGYLPKLQSFQYEILQFTTEGIVRQRGSLILKRLWKTLFVWLRIMKPHTVLAFGELWNTFLHRSFGISLLPAQKGGTVTVKKNSFKAHIGNMSIALRQTLKNVNLSFKPDKKSGAQNCHILTWPTSIMNLTPSRVQFKPVRKSSHTVRSERLHWTTGRATFLYEQHS